MSLDIPKLNDFERRLLKLAKQQFPKETKKFLRKVAAETLKISRRITKERTKRLTGNLQKGWRRGWLRQRGKEYYTLVQNKAPHAHLLEDGHRMTKEKGGPEISERVEGRHILQDSLTVMGVKFPGMTKAWLEKMVREAGL